MHLQNLPVEVFVRILRLLESRDLLRCATVCSRWKDFALDVKWKEHGVELVDMLRALGPIRQYSADGTIFAFKTLYSSIEHAVASPGWRRLNELRKKITRLRVGQSIALIDIQYLMDIQALIEPPHRPFCPNLQQLQVELGLQSQPYAYASLAGDSLASFDLTWYPIVHSPRRLMASAMQMVALRSPMIQHIEASVSDSPFINYGLFPNLRILAHEGEFSMKSWAQLCTGCPVLEVVQLQWRGSMLADEDQSIYLVQDIQTPLALEVLEVSDGLDGVPSLYILQNTNMPQLRRLDVVLERQGSPETNTMLFSNIRSHSPLLEALTVTGERLDWGEIILTIAESLPNMDSLRISSSDEGLDRTRNAFTPALLESIVKRCHQLSDLAVPLDTLSTPWTSEPPTLTCKFTRLESLILDPLHAAPWAVEPVAQYLAQLCPSVDDFDSYVVHPDENGVESGRPNYPTKEEKRSIAEMERLFFRSKAED
ncbi:hypothetical protein FRC01_005375, partial [Tulasnella sp. 417]